VRVGRLAKIRRGVHRLVHSADGLARLAGGARTERCSRASTGRRRCALSIKVLPH
jgi:hypothetical protein